jgi:hypothetical protein
MKKLLAIVLMVLSTHAQAGWFKTRNQVLAEKHAKESVKQIQLKLNKIKKDLEFNEMVGVDRMSSIADKWKEFYDWLVENGAVGLAFPQDIERLQKSFTVFAMAVCDSDIKTYSDAVATLMGITTKLMTYFACTVVVPFPASTVVAPYVCQPIGFIIGHYAGGTLGRYIHMKQCGNFVNIGEPDILNFDYTATVEWANLRNSYPTN